MYQNKNMAGLYLHIPFCKKRCIYCDFYSTTLGAAWRKRYVAALCQELTKRKSYLKGEELETIYLGGGTPSQLDEDNLTTLFQAIATTYNLERCNEITIEANPDDLTPSYIELLQNYPINRISIGIQTFHDKMLTRLNRRHTSQQAIEAVENCTKAGFTNLSIDLMYGLPGETLADWEKDIQQAIALHPNHISAYHLIYEEGTALWQLKEQHQVSEVEEDLSLAFFSTLIQQLTAAGYEQYEISNFSLPGYASKHNSSYWEGTPYLGCGPSAHSFDGLYRSHNPKDIVAYTHAIEKGLSLLEVEETTLYTRYNDYIITSLRTSKGLSLTYLKDKFGETLYRYCCEQAQPHLQQEMLLQRGHSFFISKKGLFISDGIMSDLLFVEEE